MILYILIGLILASLVFAFLSAKTWHWGYVILVEAIFLASVAFFILAAETLRINAVYRSQIKRDQAALDMTRADTEALRSGTNDMSIIERLRNADPPTLVPEGAESMPSLAQLDHELLLETRRRGRVWRNVAGAVNPQTGAVNVTVPGTPPKANTIVYLFEDEFRPPPAPPAAPDEAAPAAPPPPPPPQPNRKLQYLGEFNVAQITGQQVSLQPVQPLLPTDPEVRRLAASAAGRVPWAMYETMPMDRDELFASMTEEQLKTLLPPQVVNEYLRHGKDATADDDPWRKVGLDENGKPLPPEEMDKATKTVFHRRLRDYAAEFDEQTRRRVALLAERDALTRDIAALAEAQQVAQKLQAARTEERQRLTTDLENIVKERTAIEKHLAQVEELLAKARQLTADLQASNRDLVAQLAAIQLGPEGSAATAPSRALPLARSK